MRNKLLTTALEYILIFLVVTFVLIKVYGLNLETILIIPVHYDLDTLDILKRFKLLLTGDWIPGSLPQSTNLGAPYSYYDGDFPQPIPGQLLFQKITAASIGNIFAAFNIYIILSFYLAAFSMHWVLKKFNTPLPLSIALSIVFTFLPFHYLRIMHTNYVQYFYLPIIIYLMLKIWEKTPIFFEEFNGKLQVRINMGNVAKIGVIGFFATWNFYYTFFLTALAIVSTVSATFKNKSPAHAISGLIFTACLLAPFAASYYPYIDFNNEYTANELVAQRDPGQSIGAGLVIADLALPVNGHRIESLNEIRDLYNKTTPLKLAAGASTVGAITTVGFLLLIIFSFIDAPTNKIKSLASLNLACLIIAVPGGLGSLFAYLVSPQIREYGRISIIICTLAIFVIALCWIELSKKIKCADKVILILAPTILMLAIYDQIPPQHKIGLNVSDIKAFNSDKNFISNIESILTKKDARVFQLPYICWPECIAPGFGWSPYPHVIGYLHSKSMKWSYGGVRGRISDQWYSGIAKLKTENMISALKVSGFSGIYIDRRGYTDKAALLESEIQSITHTPPIVSPDGKKAFFQIQPTDNNFSIYNNILGDGFHGWEGSIGGHTWSKKRSELNYHRLTTGKHSYTISFELSTLNARTLIIDGPQGQATYNLSPSQTISVSLEIDQASADKPITFISVEPTVDPGNGDPRELAFALGNLSIIEKDTGRDLVKLSREALE
jgi:phosphoglycerol transferase